MIMAFSGGKILHKEKRSSSERGSREVIQSLLYLSVYCLFSCSGMDMLTRPDVSREKLLDVIPSLKHLDESLRERLVIEGKYIQNIFFIGLFSLRLSDSKIYI